MQTSARPWKVKRFRIIIHVAFGLFSRSVRVPADADSGRDLPTVAKHEFGQVRSVEQRHFETADKIRRTVPEHYRQERRSPVARVHATRIQKTK